MGNIKLFLSYLLFITLSAGTIACNGENAESPLSPTVAASPHSQTVQALDQEPSQGQLPGEILPISSSQKPVTGKAEILWDNWGVPHIFATDKHSLFKAFGWSQMRNHANAILRLYAQARGRAAEVFGEQYFISDKLVRSFEVPKKAVEWYNQQDPEFKTYIDAFVEGLNAYATANPLALDSDARKVLPITSSDVVGRAVHISLTFLIMTSPCRSVVPPFHLFYLPGSNGWALSPAHSESGNAMLLANPHLPWMDYFSWHEAQLTIEDPNKNRGKTSIYGVSFLGLPTPEIAFNDHLGWTHTVNTLQGCEAFLLEETPQKDGYVFDSQEVKFLTSTEEIKVKGRADPIPLTVLKSIHGPVFDYQNAKVAIRIPAVQQDKSAGALKQWWDMANATRFSDFEAILKRLQLPMFNVLYSDREGNAFFLHAGVALDQSGYDFLPFMTGFGPGNTSKTLATQFRPYEDLPRVLNPSSGWVQNSNSPPWFSTFPNPPSPSNYPADISYPRPMSLRDQRSVKLLTAVDRMSFEQVIESANSTHVEMADRLLDGLLQSAKVSSIKNDKTIRVALETLNAWDRKADATSQGMLLFSEWYQKLSAQFGHDGVYATPFDPQAPLLTPTGLKDPETGLKVLKDVATEILAKYSQVNPPWGEVAKIHYGRMQKFFPVSGGPGDPFGIFRSLLIDADVPGYPQSIHGNGYVAAVEFSRPVRAEVLLTYGNSSDPSSPHYGDQLKLFTEKKMRHAWLTRSDVEANLELKEEL